MHTQDLKSFNSKYRNTDSLKQISIINIDKCSVNYVKDLPNFSSDLNTKYYVSSRNRCLAGILSIRSNGDIYPCAQHTLLLGNIINNELKELLSHSGKIAEVWNEPFMKNSKCPKCKFRYKCVECSAYNIMNSKMCSRIVS